jgi:hypothetical protein
MDGCGFIASHEQQDPAVGRPPRVLGVYDNLGRLATTGDAPPGTKKRSTIYLVLYAICCSGCVYTIRQLLHGHSAQRKELQPP